MRRTLLICLLPTLAACPATREPVVDPPPVVDSDALLVSVASCTDLKDRVAESWLENLVRNRYSNWGWFGEDVADATPGDDGAEAGPTDYSETNTQEEGVDEPDIVETDGQYVYSIERDTLFITDSWPADEAHLVGSLTFDTSVHSMFLDGDRILAFSYDYDAFGGPAATQWRGDYGTKLTVIDVSDRAAPTVLREATIEGWFADARRIDGDVYVVTNAWMGMPQELWDLLWDETLALPEFDWDGTEEEQELQRAEARDLLRPYVEAAVANYDGTTFLPRIVDGNGVQTLNDCTDVLRPTELTEASLLNVVHFDLRQGASGGELTGTTLLSSGWEVYASQDNLFVTQSSWWWWWGWGAMDLNTHIHQFQLDGTQPEYKGSGSVPGWLLNQFSLSDYEGVLRVATTDIDWWWGTETDDEEPANNVFTLRRSGTSLNILGEVRGIAPGERIMAARFLGDRGYLVTFEQIDPLFTLDLSDPTDPTVVGELEITGFSSYLHPIDEDHLLTVGMEGTEDGQITGLAISIFDVSDFANPTLADRLVVQSDDWSWSESLWDHHAFTFHRDTLNIPIYTWTNGVGFSGMLSVDVDVDAGLTEIGRVSHEDLVGDSLCYWGNQVDCDDWYWYAWMRRSVVIEDNLFSLSNYGIKVTDLADPSDELAEIVYWPR